MVFRALTPTGARPGSLLWNRLMAGQNGFLWEQGEHQHPLPPCPAAGGLWGEQSQLRGRSVPDWWRQIRSPPLLRNAARGGAAGAGRRVCNQSRPPRKIPALLTKGKEQKQPLHSKIYGPQQAGKNPMNISANPASVRSYRVIGVSPSQTRSCCLS